MRLRHPATPRALPLVLALVATCGAERVGDPPASTSNAPERVRVAVFDERELSTGKLETVDAEGRGSDLQLVAAAEIVRRVAPDILVSTL